MASQKRIDSSRANGAKSRGPVTPEGKRRSSRNAITHGILSDFILLEAEGAAGFDILVQAHRERFQPADLVEHGIVEEMCAAKWRLYRAWAAETSALDAQMALETGDSKLASAFQTVAASPGAALLQRYESRLQLIYQRAVRTLIMVRTVARPDPSLSPFDPDTLFYPQPDPPNEPSPAPDAPAAPQPTAATPAQPADSIGISLVARPVHPISPETAVPAVNPPAEPAADRSAPPPRPIEPGGAV